MSRHHARLDPEVREAIIAFHHPSIPVLREMPVDEAREFLDLFVRQNPVTQVEVGAVRDLELDAGDRTVPARLYLPPGREAPHPTLIWFHGGGWVFGSIEGADADARKLCRGTGAAVLSVGYRLAPEHPHPAAVEDAFLAVDRVAEGAIEGLATDRFAVGGDSAGGNLAAICALRGRNSGTPGLAAQLLVYPVLDDDLDRPSYEAYASGLLLETADMSVFWDRYCPDPVRRRHWTATPLNAEHHAGLAPAVLVIADLDPLRSEEEAWAEAVRADGVEVDVVRYPDLPHGAFGMSDNCAAVRTANREACARLARRLGTDPLD